MPRHLPGMSLVETLAAMGAAIALAGVVSPLLVSAKERAAASAEFSELHKLVVAQSLYTAETGGIPMSTLPLVQGGYVAADACTSPQDPTSIGLANALDRDIGYTSQVYGKLEVPYRNSYVGLREFAFPYAWLDNYLEHLPESGWLVSLTTTKHLDPDHWNSFYAGTYRRVCLDGSVQTRKHEQVMIPSLNGFAPAQHSFFLFADGSDQWKRKFISGHP